MSQASAKPQVTSWKLEFRGGSVFLQVGTERSEAQ
jgi:hypothetical protein